MASSSRAAATLALLLLSSSLPALAQDAGPTPDSQARRAQVVAQGKGVEITVGELEDYINQQPPALRARYQARDQRKQLLEELLKLELLATEAERRGLHQHAAVKQTVKEGAVQALVRSEIDEKVTADSVSQADIAAYYQAHPDEFNQPAQRRASHIALTTREQALALLPEAQKADLRGFSELARKHSADPDTRLRGGDLSFLTREPLRDEPGRKIDPALRTAVFELRAVGDTTSEPIGHDSWFSIVRLTGERPARSVTLSEAESSIRSRLWRERRQKAVSDLLDRLRQQDKPQVFAERVELVRFDDMDKRPIGFAPDPVRPANDAASQDAQPR